MSKHGKMKAEKLFAETQKKSENASNKRDQETQKRIEHTASLKSQRLAKKASDEKIAKATKAK